MLRICLGSMFVFAQMAPAEPVAAACISTPFKKCVGKVAYSCIKVARYSPAKHMNVCVDRCNKDLTGGFGPCP